ncbi:blue (type1) copper domain-containing protein [Candidatus Nitrosarchaeum limnium SFB1]|jgi:predicted secreted protein with PEFG-CTERM motif|uniref:Blue (Type1) copper domain-containing protein n=1 Tax=Candidatus Nitrosarchaeum limnium SFB1 TaxID=886738 RepID=F3KLM0_9ARCH|nr:blue (type1) copper domain-containing protein [Candidatus Nitrosarchaeum limnium SFB1]
MKTIAISSFFVLFAIVAGLVATPAAFADHSEVTVVPAPGSSSLGCEKTDIGCYVPKEATVDVGGKVIFSNTDTAAHTFSAGSAEDGPSGAFDSSFIAPGNSFEWSPTTTGSFPYYCMVHPWMEGLIVVQEAGAEKHDEGMTDESMADDTMMKDVSATGMLSDGTKVSVSTSAPTTGEKMKISIEFAGKEHVNHDIMVTQNGEEVLNDMAAHHHDGKGVHETAPLKSSDPVEITITFQGYGVDDPKTGPIGEKVVFSNVVPEFGTIAMMILAVSIISIVAVTAKSKVIPRF